MKHQRPGGEGMGSILVLGSVCLSFSSLVWALRLARRTACAEANALLDPLTGAFNRRGWDTMVARATARSRRNQTTLTVFIMDIDEFKLINDKHGHLHGDRVLKDVATAIRSSARADDIVARIGGDEFALLVLDGEKDAPDAILSRLEPALAAVGVGMSVGFGTIEPGADVAIVMDKADCDMYRHKHAKQSRRLATHSSTYANVRT